MWGKKTPKILLVEDAIENHKLYQDAFTETGFEVTICQNADGDFVGEVLAADPDIISMDLMIGRLNAVTQRDGFDAIKLLKEDERTDEIPVIVLTNFSEEKKVLQAKELGVVDFIGIQSQSIMRIAAQFKSYVDKPKRYKPSHPLFRE